MGKIEELLIENPRLSEIKEESENVFKSKPHTEQDVSFWIIGRLILEIESMDKELTQSNEDLETWKDRAIKHQ